MQNVRIADLILPSSKITMGLARIERAKPLTRSDARCPRSFCYGTRVAVPTPNPTPLPAPPPIWVVQSCCAPGPTYMLKLGPSVIEIVPVQSGATL